MGNSLFNKYEILTQNNKSIQTYKSLQTNKSGQNNIRYNKKHCNKFGQKPNSLNKFEENLKKI